MVSSEGRPAGKHVFFIIQPRGAPGTALARFSLSTALVVAEVAAGEENDAMIRSGVGWRIAKSGTHPPIRLLGWILLSAMALGVLLTLAVLL